MRIALLSTLLIASSAFAQLPPPPKEMSPWPISYTDTLGVVSAADLLDKPAGKNGPVVARDGHFYTGDKRIRFWGVNVCFAGNFPTHADADKLAARFATLGINAVRFHHMDNQVFPSGIFADNGFEKLSPEAMDRLDYFIAALKKQGVYTNLNLHVSRMWSRSKGWPDTDKIDSYDKVLDIFHPDLIAANKQYANDLLTHVNKYTGNRYADEPAVCMVEINNEDTIFMWGGEGRLEKIPPRYLSELKTQWNRWLAAKYGSREKLDAAWKVGEQPLGENLLTGPWRHEAHEGAAVTVTSGENQFGLDVTKVTSTDWHVQFTHPGLKLKKGQFYTLSFQSETGRPNPPARKVNVGQAHAPWQNLGLDTTFAPTLPQGVPPTASFGFVASADDDNARVSFVVGQSVGSFSLTNLQFREGGQQGLSFREDPAQGTVSLLTTRHPATASRRRDWYEFLQHVDETYWVGMRKFLREEIGVKAPITGTIALGPLGAIAQAKMDFVDTHAYWDHPSFPHKAWDSKDWLIDNDAMVDNPAGSTFWSLAAARVAGKPFTVTEYNHSAPNEWQAECVPMIASYAALQDWDAVFLFAYSHNANWDKRHTTGFFDIEGNPTKIPFLPLAARMFLVRENVRGVHTLPGMKTIQFMPDELYDNPGPYFSSIWPFVRDVKGVPWSEMLERRFAISFDTTFTADSIDSPIPVTWSSKGPKTGTGRYQHADERDVVFVGFPGDQPIKLGPVTLGPMQSRFVSLMLTSADPQRRIEQSDRLLLTVAARSESTETKWTTDRRSVNNNWGQAPALIEVVKGQITVPGRWQVKSINPDGTPGEAIEVKRLGETTIVPLGTTPTLWYELTRVK